MWQRQSKERRGISRRSFLKGSGSAAAAVAAAGTGLLAGAAPVAAQQQPSGGVLEPGQSVVNLKVNGTPYRVDVADRVTLLELLQDQLGFTGAKLGCDRAECGACTVLLDGRAVYSCSQLAVWAEGREVTTIEGLSTGGKLHPLQQAFIAGDAGQCNYCIPGQIMAAQALLAKVASPTEAQIRKAVSGNICRCGNYNHIVSSVMQAARIQRGEAVA